MVQLKGRSTTCCYRLFSLSILLLNVFAFLPLQRQFRLCKTTSCLEHSGNDNSIESIQQKMVRYGLAWKQTPLKNADRVPGCVSTVYVQAVVSSEKDANSVSVRIVGNADAIVSRGLLAMLAECLEQLNPCQILDLDPETITRKLNLHSALSPGRNDGMANMLKVIQSQLRGDERGKEEDVCFKEKAAGAKPKPTVALLLSGGVDSSVALRLLQQDGYDVTAFYIKIWLEDELSNLGECPWEDDVGVCQEVCDQAGVPLRIVSLQEEYHERVMQHTIQEAAAGRTPNPDILCNSRVKFGCFFDMIDENEFDFVASGHYAQLVRGEEGEPVRLIRAPDAVKDQSYFLCALSQNQVQRLLFPIGHLQKTQVRQLAEYFELPNRKRPDSQGLCFLGKIKFSDFLNAHLGSKEGEIVDAFSGNIIGRHQGVWYHTVGQRKGLGKSLFPLATSEGPWYVVAKDPAENIIYASNQYDEEVFTQARSEFHVENIHWIAGKEPEELRAGPYNLWLKIRHGPRLVQGSLQVMNGDEGIVTLNAKDGGLAPGQYAVFYTDDAVCLGGGIISERHWAKFLVDTQNRSELVAGSPVIGSK